jgi:hypothetical protein
LLPPCPSLTAYHCSLAFDFPPSLFVALTTYRENGLGAIYRFNDEAKARKSHRHLVSFSYSRHFPPRSRFAIRPFICICVLVSSTTDRVSSSFYATTRAKTVRDILMAKQEIKMLLSAVGESGKVRRWNTLIRNRALTSALHSQSLLKYMNLIRHGGYNNCERDSYEEIIFSKTIRFVRSVLLCVKVSIYSDNAFLPVPPLRRCPKSTLPAVPQNDARYYPLPSC